MAEVESGIRARKGESIRGVYVAHGAGPAGLGSLRLRDHGATYSIFPTTLGYLLNVLGSSVSAK